MLLKVGMPQSRLSHVMVSKFCPDRNTKPLHTLHGSGLASPTVVIHGICAYTEREHAKGGRDILPKTQAYQTTSIFPFYEVTIASTHLLQNRIKQVSPHTIPTSKKTRSPYRRISKIIKIHLVIHSYLGPLNGGRLLWNRTTSPSHRCRFQINEGLQLIKSQLHLQLISSSTLNTIWAPANLASILPWPIRKNSSQCMSAVQMCSSQTRQKYCSVGSQLTGFGRI